MTVVSKNYNMSKNKISGQAWQLVPVIPALREAKEGRSLEVRSLRTAWPKHGETLSPLKM